LVFWSWMSRAVYVFWMMVKAIVLHKLLCTDKHGHYCRHAQLDNHYDGCHVVYDRVVFWLGMGG
jgi:hypothetical protein